jgi:hypothetical protein
METNRNEMFVFRQPRGFDERKELAKVLVERLKYRIPLAIDGMDDGAGQAFAAWPERIYILGQEGRVLYKGGMGPFGFLPEEAEAALARALGAASD